MHTPIAPAANNRHRACWLITLIFICVCASACTPMSIWMASRDTEEVTPVLALPPDYDPLQSQPPYSGPHPASLPIEAARFKSPVRLGEVGPIDTSLGPLQYPFACETEESGLGPPLIDNHDGIGTPVIVDGETLGYSKDCLVKTQADYYFKAINSDRLRPLTPDTDPAMIDTAEVNGRRAPFVVRLERGTINRFIYAIAVLADPEQPLDEPSAQLWNGKLIYYFRGGVGIGKRQGDVRPSSATRRRMAELAQGYAVAFSSGTQTSVHYNLWLAAHTAAMVKHQFIGLYGEPEYTVGIGGSGGAVQQLLVAQNEPGLLDALIPQYSYPDMVTQSIWAYDCELLEYYFDITARDQKRWQVQEQRTLIEGLSADSDATNLYNKVDFWSRLVRLRLPRLPGGATECSASWRGLTPLTNNPTYTHHSYRYAPAVHKGGRWSHWHDVKYIYGVDEDGYAYRTYDNVGVQYGLLALRSGDISPAEFLHLNANIGGWKPPKQMRQERFWVVNGNGGLGDVRLWGDQNMQKTPSKPVPLAEFQQPGSSANITPAPRTAGYIPAIEAAYRAGQVFIGAVDIPIIDVRHYLDDQLDMHHSFASLAARQRLLRYNGQVVGGQPRFGCDGGAAFRPDCAGVRTGG